jgi:hypothetical protein
MASLSQSSKGYCMKFTIPSQEIENLYDDVSEFNKDQVIFAFKKQWLMDNISAPMYFYIYYLNLNLAILYGERQNNKEMARHAISLMLFNLWNGRVTDAFPRFCNEDIMNYVTSTMMNSKYLAHKYDTPLKLIQTHFRDNLLKKYGPMISKDSSDTKRLFSACFNSLRQLFRSDSYVDLKQGGTRYRSGLQPLYYKAQEQGLKVSTISANTSSEMGQATDSYTSHSFDEIIEGIANYIVTNHKPIYSNSFIEFLKNTEKVNIKDSKILEIILQIHNTKHYDLLTELLQLYFSKFGFDATKQVICSDTFLSVFIKKKIVSSKHNKDSIQIKLLVDNFLEKIFQSLNSAKFSEYSETNKSVIRKVLYYGIGYNIQKYTCR